MKIRPIIFSAPMVRALLDCRKTQTRRLASSPLAKAEPGDLLYVRESFAMVSAFGGVVRYAATDDIHELRKVRPSIHMPRWASRLTLEITERRMQKLQWIRNADILAEGFTTSLTMAALWDELHGKGSWDKNPDVVALTFKVHNCNVDQMAKEAA